MYTQHEITEDLERYETANIGLHTEHSAKQTCCECWGRAAHVGNSRRLPLVSDDVVRCACVTSWLGCAGDTWGGTGWTRGCRCCADRERGGTGGRWRGDGRGGGVTSLTEDCLRSCCCLRKYSIWSFSSSTSFSNSSDCFSSVTVFGDVTGVSFGVTSLYYWFQLVRK